MPDHIHLFINCKNYRCWAEMSYLISILTRLYPHRFAPYIISMDRALILKRPLNSICISFCRESRIMNAGLWIIQKMGESYMSKQTYTLLNKDISFHEKKSVFNLHVKNCTNFLDDSISNLFVLVVFPMLSAESVIIQKMSLYWFWTSDKHFWWLCLHCQLILVF